MVGKTERTLKDNILDPLESMVGKDNYHHNRGTGELFIAGRKIILRGANDEQAESKIRGITLSGVYGDELTLWPESFFRQCMLRMSVEGAKFFGTTNPDSPYHWLKTDYIDKHRDSSASKPLDLAAFHFELADNLNLPPSFIENLLLEYTGLWFKRFIKGMWVVAEGAIYDQFDEDLHVVHDWSEVWKGEGRPPFERVLTGIDYGTSHPTAFLALGLYRGVWYFFAEYRHEGAATMAQATDAEHSTALTAFLHEQQIHPEQIEVDPAAASFKTQLERDGYNNLHNANNDVLDGIRVFSSAITTNRVKIHASCIALIKEIQTYVWDPKKQERGIDEPIKKLDDSVDAGRYAVMEAIGRTQPKILAKPKGA